MNCPRDRTKATPTPEMQHYAREDCLDCGRFIKWLPHPETIKRQEENLRRVKVLQGMKQNAWTVGFLSTFPKKPSPKQQAKLDDIWKEQCK